MTSAIVLLIFSRVIPCQLNQNLETSPVTISESDNIYPANRWLYKNATCRVWAS